MKNSVPNSKEYSINLIVLQEPDSSRLLKTHRVTGARTTLTRLM